MLKQDEKRKLLRKFWLSRSFMALGVLISLGIAVPRLPKVYKQWTSHNTAQEYKQYLRLSARLQELRQDPNLDVSEFVGSRRFKDPKLANELLRQAVQASKDIKYASYQWQVLSSIASAYGQLGDAKLANELLQQAVQVSKDVKGAPYQSNALSRIASAYGQLGDAKLANELLQQAVQVSKDIKDASYHWQVLSRIASAYGQLGDAKLANEGLQALVQVFKDIKDAPFQSLALSSIASAYGQLGEVEGIGFQLSKFQGIPSSKKVQSETITMTQIQFEILYLSIPIFLALVLILLLLKQQNPLSMSGTGQLIVVLPEECVAELTMLKQRMQAEQRPSWFIRLRLIQETLELLLAFSIRIRLDNLGLPSQEKRIDD